MPGRRALRVRAGEDHARPRHGRQQRRPPPADHPGRAGRGQPVPRGRRNLREERPHRSQGRRQVSPPPPLPLFTLSPAVPPYA